ncbi:MAG: Trm112 family protein [Nitrospinae bacterium]|nr:Trm112 family protein [Nitrospinota bacterium]
MPVDKELLEILACPKCKGELELTENQDGLVCRACKLVYEIRDDIPIMLIDEAKPLNE